MTPVILQQIFETILIPLLIAGTGFLIKWLNAKTAEIKETTHNEKMNKYITLLDKTITDCVIATSQTYVDSLKQQNAFTEEAQKEAFRRSYCAVMEILSAEAKVYLTEFYGDLNIYITQLIEAEVNRNK